MVRKKTVNLYKCDIPASISCIGLFGQCQLLSVPLTTTYFGGGCLSFFTIVKFVCVFKMSYRDLRSMNAVTLSLEVDDMLD